jgi:hypothetical protein
MVGNGRFGPVQFVDSNELERDLWATPTVVGNLWLDPPAE